MCKGLWIFSFAKDIGKHLGNEYGKKVLDNAKKSTTDAIKNASKRAIQKTAEATGDLMNKKYQKKDIYLQKKTTNY